MAERARQLDRADGARRFAVALVTLAANLGTFGFLVLVGRSAAPAVLGALVALAAVALLFEVPANALQAAIGASAGTGESRSHGARGLASRSLMWGGAAGASLVALSPLIERFLHLPSVFPVLLLGAEAVAVSAGAVPKGLLTGTGRLAGLAAALMVGTGVRLGLGVALVRDGAGVTGALAAMVAGEAAAAGVLLFLTRAAFAERGDAAPARPRLPWAEAEAPALAFTGYWALSAADVFTARHWLTVEASGWYAAAATAAQLALIAPGAVAAFSFPRLASIAPPRPVSPENRPWQRLMFALASAAVAVTGFLAAALVSGFATPLVEGLFGDSYGPAARVVGLLGFVAALLGLLAVLVHYHLNRGLKRVASLGWVGAVAVVAGTAVWHSSMDQVALVMVASSSAVCAAMLAAALGHRDLRRAGLVEKAQLALLDADLDLTVVVPYYNPGRLLVPTVERILSVLEASGATYEVIAVSDGSTDGSERELDALAARHPPLTNLVLAHNQGKGAALRVGLARGKGRYLGFIDADGDLDPLLLGSFQTMVRLYQPDIILGSKRHPLSEVEYPFIRRVYSWGYQQLVRLGFRLNIRDTQTGIKLVRRDVLAAVLPRMVEKRFAFDLELFVIARRLGYKRFLEAPIRLRHQFTSTVSWRAVYRSLLDTAAIWYRLRILRFYDGEQAPATPVGERLRIDPVVLRGGAGAGAGSTNAPGHAGTEVARASGG
jgi:glycosyltransferase involved in cell wall biosynthesis/O-antigen/teichoic acid export membrane protein